MRLSREKWFEIAAALLAIAVAYSFVYLGWWAFGRRGVLVLIFGVPVSLGFGWVAYKLLVVAGTVLAEDSEGAPSLEVDVEDRDV